VKSSFAIRVGLLLYSTPAALRDDHSNLSLCSFLNMTDFTKIIMKLVPTFLYCGVSRSQRGVTDPLRQ
jgi:hypothetical protein